MSKQQNLMDFFPVKKIKAYQEPIRLTTPIFSDDEDQISENQELRDNESSLIYRHYSPFSIFKTSQMTTLRDFAHPGVIQKLDFSTSPNKNLFDFNFKQNNQQKQINNTNDPNQHNVMKNGTLDRWVQKKAKNDTWPYLQKEIVYKVFSYLNLRDCALASQVCRYWKVCYHNIYFCYSFLKEFDSNRYSEREMATVFKKAGSKMKHIRKIRDILKGQKLGPLMQRARVSAKLSQNSENQGSLLEAFRLEPKKAGSLSSIFLTDKTLLSICNDSNQSLQFMSLVSCQFVTGSGFEGLRKCSNIQYLNIQNNSHITADNLEIILQELPKLHTLILAKCPGLTSDILTIISKYSSYIERLDLGANPQIKFDKVRQLNSLKKLGSLSVRQTSISNQDLKDLLISVPQLHSLNMSGCLCLNDLSICLIRQYGQNLTRINLTCVRGISEQDVYELVQQLYKLQVLLINNNLLSQRIEETLGNRN